MESHDFGEEAGFFEAPMNLRSRSGLIVDLGSSPANAEEITAALTGHTDTWRVVTVRDPSLADLVALVEQHRVDVVFLLPGDPPWPGKVRELPAAELSVPAFAVTATEDAEAIFGLLELGYSQIVRPPFTSGTAPSVLRRVLGWPRADSPPSEVRQRVALDRLVGRSPAFLHFTHRLPIVARADVNVLICGETGTGKEMAARTIHYLSRRAGGPFVAANCSAIPVDLLENEFFGHQPGAFTGATRPQKGLVEEAAGGTLLLDEIDCLPLAAQSKLLRFLQEKEYRRLGSCHVEHGDVRLIAASNVDVAAAVVAGRFRSDLFYRLNVVPLSVPPLRERREDIPLLAHHFLHCYSKLYATPRKQLSDAMLAALLEHDWPGNVRELEHVIQRAVVLSEGRLQVTPADGLIDAPEPPLTFRQAKARVVERFERSYLESALAAHRGNVSRAARAGGQNRRAFWELMRKHSIDARRFRPPK